MNYYKLRKSTWRVGIFSKLCTWIILLMLQQLEASLVSMRHEEHSNGIMSDFRQMIGWLTRTAWIPISHCCLIQASSHQLVWFHFLEALRTSPERPLVWTCFIESTRSALIILCFLNYKSKQTFPPRFFFWGVRGGSTSTAGPPGGGEAPLHPSLLDLFSLQVVLCCFTASTVCHVRARSKASGSAVMSCVNIVMQRWNDFDILVISTILLSALDIYTQTYVR